MEDMKAWKSLEAYNQLTSKFRADDILCLVEGIANETVVIMSKLQSSITNKKKEVWREITAKVTAFGVALRTEDDIKKKWKDLRPTIS